MKVTGFWSFLGLVGIGWIIADLVTHPSGTEAGFNGITALEKNTGNQVIGTAA